MSRSKLREKLYAGLSPNGKKVHLANIAGRPVCGSDVSAHCRVHARVTCPACARARPDKARRLGSRPLVVGLNWEPLYAALGRAVARGETEEPRVRVPYWPVLAD
jgi:hypothetical protein